METPKPGLIARIRALPRGRRVFLYVIYIIVSWLIVAGAIPVLLIGNGNPTPLQSAYSGTACVAVIFVGYFIFFPTFK